MVRKVYSEDTMGVLGTVPTPPTDVQSVVKTELFAEIAAHVANADSSRTEWEDKMERYHRLRMRIKKPKTFPFKNSSNLRMPTAEKNIRKIKAGVMGIVYGARPVVQVLPSPATTLERAQKIEKLLDHLIMNVIKAPKVSEIGIDRSLEKGFSILKVFWCRDINERDEFFNLEEMPLVQAISLFFMEREQIVPLIIQRFDIDMHDAVAEDNLREIQEKLDDVVENGTTKVEFTVRDVIYDFPQIAYVNPERLYIPTDSGFEIQESQSVPHEIFIPLNTIKMDAKRKGYDLDAVNQLVKLRSLNLEDKNIEMTQEQREGISRMQNPSGLVRVWECYGWYDIDGDGKPEKSIVTAFPDFNLIARAVKLNNLSGRYPFVKLYWELTDDRWYSHRGIPETLEDIIKEIDVQHNMKIDSQTVRNAPMFLYRSGIINPNLVRMIPNQAIPVNGMQPLSESLQVLNLHNPNTEFSYDREQQLLNLEVQETVGQVDFSLQSVINKRQPRTLGEVQQQVAATGQVFSMDARHYIDSFTELFNMIFELWCQFGPDTYEFNYFGDSAQGEKIKLTKEELQGKYTITVRGNDQTLNPQIKIEKAQQILAAITNPLLLQLGVVGQQQVANGLKRFFQAMDIESLDDIIISNPQPPTPPDPKSMVDITKIFSELTEGEQAQVLPALGITPDVGDRQRKQIQDIATGAADIADKVYEEKKVPENAGK